jgi:hypothetical protein
VRVLKRKPAGLDVRDRLHRGNNQPRLDRPGA